MQVVVGLTPDMRRVIAEMMPRLPEEGAGSGGGTDGVLMDFISSGCGTWRFQWRCRRSWLRVQIGLDSPANAELVGRLAGAG